KRYKNDSIYMVVGQDILSTLPKWKQWNQIKKIINIVCINRSGYSHAINHDNDKRDILFIDTLDSDISSSIIRKKILSNDLKEFLSINNMLDKDVFNYIQNKNKICQH
ncbi:uncharacterized protein METZ01_LOCUS398573, partial [marine metagenome]